MRSYENLYRNENLEQHLKQESLKKKVYDERGLSILYRVKKLKNHQMSKDETSTLFEKNHEQLQLCHEQLDQVNNQQYLDRMDTPQHGALQEYAKDLKGLLPSAHAILSR